MFPRFICIVKVSIRKRVFETIYEGKDKSQYKLKRVNKYQKKKNGEYKLKNNKKVKTIVKNPAYQYYLDIYNGSGRRETQFLNVFILPTDTKQEREDKLDFVNKTRNRIEQELEADKYENVLPKYRERIDFLKYCELYRENYKNKDHRKLEGAIKHFKTYLKSKHNKQRLSMTSFDKVVANGFIQYLAKDSGLSGDTPKSYLKKIKAIVRSAQFDKYIKEDPFQFLSTKSLKTDNKIKKEVLTEDELVQLYKTQCGNEIVRRAFFFACYTGMGRAEIVALKWSHISFKNKTIKYSRAKSEVPVKLHLHPDVEALLFGLDKSKEKVFNLPSTNGINKVIGSWVRRAGIDKHITFYCARHTYGTRTLRTSKNLKVVSEIMGHKSTTYTENYVRLVEDEDKKAISELPSISLNGG